jgi:hypothetical protein
LIFQIRSTHRDTSIKNNSTVWLLAPTRWFGLKKTQKHNKLWHREQLNTLIFGTHRHREQLDALHWMDALRGSVFDFLTYKMSGNPAATTGPTAPIHGGIYVLHGVYIGGVKVGDDWKIQGTRYRSSAQLKGDKWISKMESRLRTQRDNTASRKFNGKLEDAGEKEMDKDEFLRVTRRDIRAHGHEGMYAIECGGNVVDLLDHLHEFTVDEVIKSSMDRITSTGDEAYDPYTLDEIETSWLVVESFLSSTMPESIQTRFDHDDDFFDNPGNVLLVTIPEVCNASVSYEIEGAQEKFDALTLDTFQGEDISALGAKAQKQVKIMQTGYALPIRTGSKF